MDRPITPRRTREAEIRRHGWMYVTLTALLLAAMLLPGCGSEDGGSASAADSAQENAQALVRKGIRPNELGKVMILEYHRIRPTESDYTRSYENFKRDLQTLYERGYRLVTLNNLMSGRIATPAGTTPVVVSFDDSTESQFKYIEENGKTVIDPNCAVGMMKEFYDKHKDFGYTALFNYLPAMFDQPKYIKQKVDYLYENGFEFGDHTTSHPQLSKVDDATAQKEIAVPLMEMKKINPKVKVSVLCLPHGLAPKNKELMYNGSYNGFEYHLDWSLLVGSNPMYMQYHYQNPGKLLPRVQMVDYNAKTGKGAEGSGYWLAYFDNHPEARFISDGNPDTICAPAYMESRLIPDKVPKGSRFVGY